MSDIRFKIYGDSTPFLAELYKGGISSGSFIDSQIIENSGISNIPNNHTCVIFDGLLENTYYEIKIIDSINNTFYSDFNTPSNPEITDPSPTEFNFNLNGSIESSEDPNNIQKWVENGELSYSPVLETGQCLELNFASTFTSISHNSEANVEIYKSCGGTDDYTLVHNSDVPFSTNIGVGDAICYNLFVNIEKSSYHDQEASASLVLDSVGEVSGFDYGIDVNIDNDRFDISVENGESANYFLSIDPEEIYFNDENPKEGIVDITTDDDWYIKGCTGEWFEAQENQDNDRQLSIRPRTNYSNAREGSVTIEHASDSNLTATVDLYQAAYGESNYTLSITPDNLTFDANETTTKTISINSDGYDYSIRNVDGDWIQANKISSTELEISVNTNEGDVRSGITTIVHSEDEFLTTEIEIFQNATDQHYLKVATEFNDPFTEEVTIYMDKQAVEMFGVDERAYVDSSTGEYYIKDITEDDRWIMSPNVDDNYTVDNFNIRGYDYGGNYGNLACIILGHNIINDLTAVVKVCKTTNSSLL